MFDITDDAIAGLEAKGRREEEPQGYAYTPYGAAEPPSPGPSSPPVVPSPGMPIVPGNVGDSALRRGAAKGLLLCTAGLVVGGLVAGPFGAGAGVVGVGALRNIMRAKDGWAAADPEARAEAAKSVTMAIFGLGIAGMLGYQAWQRRDGYAFDR